MPYGANAASPLLFLHIRKTGGLSVRNLLVQRFAVCDSLLDWHHRQNAGLEPDQYRFVTGHCSFSAVGKFANQPFTVVFLREPLQRALSAYFFYRSNTPAFLRNLRDTLPAPIYAQRERFTREASRKSMLRFLDEDEELARSWLGDVQTRVLAGATDGEPEPCGGGELLNEASRNLASCTVVGLTERMAESVDLLFRSRGWETPAAGRHDHRTVNRPGRDEIPPEAVQILTEWNERDLQLYQTATQLFDRRARETGQAATSAPRHGTELPPARDYTFDQPIVGDGWHLRELVNDRWICWTGALPEATLRLRLESAQDQRLECRLEHVLVARVLDGLRVFVNGIQLDWRLEHREDGRWICAAVPRRAFQPGSANVVIQFVVGERFEPCALDPGVRDSRKLGIALSRIRLRPDAGQAGK